MEDQKIETQEIKSIFNIDELLIFLWFSIFLWIIHNYLIYWFSNWIWFSIFMIIFVISYFIILNLTKRKISPNQILISSTLIFFSIFKAIRIWDILNVLNSISILFLYILLFIVTFKENFKNIKARNYFPWFIYTAFGSILWIWIWLWAFVKLKSNLPKIQEKWHIVKWIFMAIPLIFLFTLIFSSADQVFNKIVSEVLDLNLANLINLSWRAINITVISALLLWIFTYAFYKIKSPDAKNEEIKFEYDSKRHIEINIVLWSLSVLFSLFVILQIWYLFSWDSFVQALWYTFSEYTRKGFTELSFSAFIIFILLWKIDEYLYSHEKKWDSKSYKIFASILISLTILILFSALNRLYLYESAYWFTEARFYWYIFIAILFFSLISTLYKTLKFMEEGEFIILNIYFYLIWIAIANIINPESFISQHNIDKVYRWSLLADSYYIEWRSDDAIDSMLILYDKKSDGDKVSMKYNFCIRLNNLKNRYPDDWRSFNYARYNALNLLSQKEVELDCQNIMKPRSSIINRAELIRQPDVRYMTWNTVR